jgi:hypothetical protein
MANNAINMDQDYYDALSRDNKPENHKEIFMRPMTWLEIASRNNEKMMECDFESLTFEEIAFEAAIMEWDHFWKGLCKAHLPNQIPTN